MIPQIGWVELTLILVIVAMLFGVGKLPEIFGAVGKGIREFRSEASVTDENPSSSAQPEPTAKSHGGS